MILTNIGSSGGGSGDALVANPLSQFAATTSLQLKGVISDETGSGALVFGTAPTLTGPVTLTGAVGSSGLTLTGATQTDSFPALAITQTWNDAADTFTAVDVNVTNTNSADASRLQAWRVGGADKSYILKTGSYVLDPSGGLGGLGPLNGGLPYLWFGSAAEMKIIGAANYLIDNTGYYGWRSAATRLHSDASDQLDLRRDENPQEIRPHGYYASATSRAYGAVKCAKAAITLSGATTATSNIIPAGCFVIGVATTTTTTITGASGYTVGDGSDADRWGDITGTAVGTDTDNTNSTANPTGYVAAASAITLTAKTSNFTGGVVQVMVFYLTTGAD